jgi:hypothetical protein
MYEPGGQESVPRARMRGALDETRKAIHRCTVVRTSLCVKRNTYRQVGSEFAQARLGRTLGFFLQTSFTKFDPGK